MKKPKDTYFITLDKPVDKDTIVTRKCHPGILMSTINHRSNDLPEFHVVDVTDAFEDMINGMSEDEVQRQVRLYNACLENRRQVLLDELQKLKQEALK
jgi:hypothetical protein